MRNNQKRFGGPNVAPQASTPAPETTGLAFAVPTEFVELPSRGRFYPEDHPLHNQETIEIRYMTAKDEDILSSEALLKKGLAIDRLVESLVVPDVSPDSLLVGDKNAILIASRISAYGSKYEINYNCPNCKAKQNIDFDLKTATVNDSCFDEAMLEEHNIVFNNETFTFDVRLPGSDVVVGLRLIEGQNESRLQSSPDSIITTLLTTILVKVNDNLDSEYVQSFIDVMPAKDSKFVRDIYPKLVPNIRLDHVFSCSACLFQQPLEVPLTAAFFWP